MSIGITACASSPTRDATTFCTAYIGTARGASALADPDDVSIATLRSQVRSIETSASKAAHHAPEEIADDVDALITPLRVLRSDLDDATSRSDVATALKRYRTSATKLVTEQKRLDAWGAANCGVVPVTSTTIPVTVQPGMTG